MKGYAVATTGQVCGSVYVIRYGDTVKIGYSENVPSRRRQLDLRTGLQGELLALVPSTNRVWPRQLERDIHRRFRHLCIGGEWFAASQELLDWAREFSTAPVENSGPAPTFAPQPQPDAYRITTGERGRRPINSPS